MSGTSMDGLDLAFCHFTLVNNKWNFSLLSTDSIPYPKTLIEKLEKATNFTARELLLFDKELGLFFAESILNFIQKHKINKEELDAISSHGHTIFHQPELGYTHQIACGETIAFHTQVKVINDFRQKDVVAGGQGAPLVPIGDFLLFSEQSNTFLNLGGFANCTVLSDKGILAFDICPANLPLNRIVQELGLAYDKNGAIAKRGTINQQVLKKLNDLAFYRERGPKSLGTEWLDSTFMPIIDEEQLIENKLATVIEHIAVQIGNTLKKTSPGQIFITGGGAHNLFLIERIQKHLSSPILIPSKEIIEFKEAIIFGFLGALYLAKQINILSSVTGASKDTIGGVLHLP